MEKFLNAVKAHAAALDRGHGQPRFATVASGDPARYAARVSLQPEGVLTGWLPILTPWVGAGWGLVCPPSPGDQVLVLPQEGDGEHGVIAGGSFSDQARPPQAPPGEIWLVHQTGSFIKLTSDGTIQMNGDLHVNGNVYDSHGSLAQLRAHYDEHNHSSNGTSPPSPQD